MKYEKDIWKTISLWYLQSEYDICQFNEFLIMASYSKKETGPLMDVLSYYSIIILCDSRCLKDIKFIYMPNCSRLFSIIKSPRTERRIQSIVSALFISIEEYWSNSTLLFNSDHLAPSRNVPLVQHSRPLDVVLELAYI